ncbi:hypothetical protein AWW66_25370 [Micromonospora rosaria]|uniref:Uncharacterized protein n=1 Tax=Micromonospora rosaria TaxID=47874 RepID=A0A136PLL0_9ACTN|nr:hypothetical protein AWW66_25370 [Micromonospora rosaria]
MPNDPDAAAGLDAAAGVLAEAGTLAFGGVGLAGAVLPDTEAYRRLEQALPSRAGEVRARLDWLLANGSPTGRAYAATLLEQVDPAAARIAWTALRADDAVLTSFTGCLLEQVTLGEYAARRLAEG